VRVRARGCPACFGTGIAAAGGRAICDAVTAQFAGHAAIGSASACRRITGARSVALGFSGCVARADV
jgi:hypothetical protein